MIAEGNELQDKVDRIFLDLSRIKEFTADNLKDIAYSSDFMHNKDCTLQLAVQYIKNERQYEIFARKIMRRVVEILRLKVQQDEVIPRHVMNFYNRFRNEYES